MDPYRIAKLNVSQLFLNLENPRYEVLKDQRLAIQTLVDDQKEKIINLAQDIANRGTNPFDLIAVAPLENSNKRFIVLEGNRRVAAIKILLEPSLIDFLGSSKIKRKVTVPGR